MNECSGLKDKTACSEGSCSKVPPNELSEFEIERSSSLSEIEEKIIREQGVDNGDDVNREAIAPASNCLDNVSQGENESEAETERLEGSPNKLQALRDFNSCSNNKFEYSGNLSSQLNKIELENDQMDTEENIRLDEGISASTSSSTKTPRREEIGREISATTKSLDIYLDKVDIITPESGLDKRKRKRKRKRSKMIENELKNQNEPSPKRTGSVLNPSEFHNTDIKASQKEDISSKKLINKSVTKHLNDSTEDTEELPDKEDLNSNTTISNECNSKEDPKKERSIDSETVGQIDKPDSSADPHITKLDSNLKSEEADIPSIEEEEETEIALKNEETIERKKIALHRLSDIERQFSTFRDRLYEERLKNLNQEFFMLQQSQPSHPEYLAKLQCIDARRDEKMRIADKLREYELQSLKKVAVAQRSQILIQCQQEIREIREEKLEQLGEQWYKIQHDRRSYSGICPEYSLRFPTKRNQQLSNQIAYNNEVSVLSGIAKYVGFPAAPIMAPISASELEEDLERMSANSCVMARMPFSTT